MRLAMNLARILGFAMAGTAVALLGAGWAVAVNAGLLVVSAALIAALRLPVTARGERGHLLRDLREGWREFRSRQWLWVVVVQYSFVVMVLQGLWGVLGPVVANARLGGARGWSWVLAAQAIGMLAGVVIAIRTRTARPIQLVVLVTFLFAGVPLALALGAPLVVVIVAALVGGVALDITMVVWETTMQREIPENVLSRVSSYDALGSLMFGPIGLLLAGPAVVHLGTATALLVSAGIIVVASLGALCSPGVRRLTWSKPDAGQVEPMLAPLSSAAPVT
jgi:hypothetical protein